MIRRLLLSIVAVATATSLQMCSNGDRPAGSVVSVDPQDIQSPSVLVAPREPVLIDGQYIVVLNETTPLKGAPSTQAIASRGQRAITLAASHGVTPLNIYDAVFPGFSASMSASQANDLRNDPQVASVEADQMVYACAQTLPTGIDRIDADQSSTIAGNGSGTVEDVEIFVIDTGIDPGNSDLDVVESKSFIKGAKNGNDDNGHGTHVAGTAAAKDNGGLVVGVAPGANLHAIKVLDRNGSGSFSDVIAGINYVTNYKATHASKACVANMSLGAYAGTASYNSLDDAVNSSIAAGVVYCIAAGNSGDDAQLYTPAHVTNAITVGAYNATKSGGVFGSSWASFSNYGSLVDILAPGVSVLSLAPKNKTATMSGTSMATPHVTGTVALYLSTHTGASPATVASAITSVAASPTAPVNHGNETSPLNPTISGVPGSTTNISVYAGDF